MTLPEGTVSFLRSDIEGSMELVRALGAGYDELNAEHQAIVRAAVTEHGGHIVRTEGDAFFAVFTDAGGAARAAVDIQHAMADHPWPADHEPRLRIGIHTGAATRAGDDYGGFEVNRAARIAAMGWGGQIVLSDPARALIVGDLPEGWQVRDLGRHRLKSLPEPERLFQLTAPGLAHGFPPLRSESTATQHLPQRATSFIGREVELDELSALVEHTRLLTLTGPGGAGKTTLALELARRHAEAHEDGAWFVDLQSVRDATLVKAEIAHGVGLFDGVAGPAADRLMDYVADRELLIIIDNFEQVVDAAGVISELLRASPRTRVIVTSRVPLRLSMEQEFPVRPLELGAGDDAAPSEAVRLFIDRARHSRPGLRIGDDDLTTIMETCQLVDGLPLAIELCAARVAALPIAVIRDRLARRLPLPGSGLRDLPERQRTIDSTVAWSYDLLTPSLQRLLMRLSVFHESFDHEQGELVCGPAEELGIDVLDGLAELVDQSLLVRMDAAADGFRFRMLETIQAYAAARMTEAGDEHALRRRHAEAFAALAEQAIAHHHSAEQGRWIDRLEADDANVRAATLWAIEHGETALAMRLSASLWRYWLASGRLVEGRELVRMALSMPGADDPSRLRSKTLDAAGGVAYWSGDLLQADACYREQLELARRLGDPEAEALAWFNLAFTRRLLGDEAGAEEATAKSSQLYEQLRDERAVVRLAWARSLAAAHAVDPSSSAPGLEAVAAKLASFDDPWSQGTALGLRAQIAMMRGDPAAATRSFLQAYRLGLALRDHADMIVALQPIVIVILRSGHSEAAATILGAAESWSERYGMSMPASFEQITGIADPAEQLIGTLGNEGFRAAHERGRRMSLEEILGLLESLIDQIPDHGAQGWLRPGARPA